MYVCSVKIHSKYLSVRQRDYLSVVRIIGKILLILCDDSIYSCLYDTAIQLYFLLRPISVSVNFDSAFPDYGAVKSFCCLIEVLFGVRSAIRGATSLSMTWALPIGPRVMAFSWTLYIHLLYIWINWLVNIKHNQKWYDRVVPVAYVAPWRGSATAIWLVPPPPMMQMFGCGCVCIGLFAMWDALYYILLCSAAAATICVVILTKRVVLKCILACYWEWVSLSQY